MKTAYALAVNRDCHNTIRNIIDAGICK